MTRRRGRPFVWLTSLSKMMAGDRSCLWSGWFRAHFEDFEKVQGDFDQARWKIRHTRLLHELATELEGKGEAVRIEEQNRFRYERASGIVVAGVADLVSLSSQTVYDCKTGRPRASDQVQVMLSMYFLPLCHPEYQGMRLDGCVVYRHARIPIPAIAIDEEFITGVEYFLDLLESATQARRVPSEMECAFCDITKRDCPERFEDRTAN